MGFQYQPSTMTLPVRVREPYEEHVPCRAKSIDMLCRAAQGSGLGGLSTFSRGFGDDRYVSVMRAGSQPQRVCYRAEGKT